MPATERAPNWMRRTGLEQLRRHVAAGADQVFGPARGTWTFRLELAVVYLLALAVTIVALYVVLTVLLFALAIGAAILYPLL